MVKFITGAVLALFISYPIFAIAHSVPADEASSPSCEVIAKACKNAGFTRNDGKSNLFWQDCMRPILFGKSVNGVTVDTKTVRACRTFKINNLKQQINDLRKHQK